MNCIDMTCVFYWIKRKGSVKYLGHDINRPKNFIEFPHGSVLLLLVRIKIKGNKKRTNKQSCRKEELRCTHDPWSFRALKETQVLTTIEQLRSSNINMLFRLFSALLVVLLSVESRLFRIR